MDLEDKLRTLLDNTLNLGGRARTFTASTQLLGSVPELDSMGVVSVLTAFEDQLGFSVDDDEIDGSIFATFGSLRTFVESKLQA